jgi:pimeloyl-ACP methyl ester carboxylesterase
MTTYFIHGFLEDSNMWETLNLPTSLSPVFIEIPGHGKKLHVNCPSSLIEIAELISQEIHDSDFQIIGHSMGGYLIGGLLQLGFRPKKIGLFHSKLGQDDDEKKQQRERAIQLVQENHSLYVRTMISNLFSTQWKDSFSTQIENLISHGQQISVSTIVNCHRAMRDRANAIELVQSLEIPCYYFAGEEDQSIPLHQLKNESSQLQALAHLTTYPAIGHMAQWENPKAAGDWILSNF